MILVEFNDVDIERKKENLRKCCGAEKWVMEMVTVFPVDNLNEVLIAAEEKWNECSDRSGASMYRCILPLAI